MKKFLAILSLGFLIFGTVSVFDAGMVVHDICAQSTIMQGIACQAQYGECSSFNSGGDEYGNLLEDLNSGAFTFQGYVGSAGTVANRIRDNYSRINEIYMSLNGTEPTGVIEGYDPEVDYSQRLCYKKGSFKYITSVVVMSDARNYNDLSQLAHTSGTLQSTYVARGCRGDLVPSFNNYGGEVGREHVQLWGCCPTGYRIVSHESGFSQAHQLVQSGVAACCLEAGAQRTPYNYASISDVQNSSSDRLGSDGEVLPHHRCEDINGEQVWSIPEFNGRPTVIPYNQDASTIKLGIFDSPIFNNNNNLRLSPAVGSEFRCPATASCALTDNNLNTVINPNRYQIETGLSCRKCFVEGEVMGYTTVGEGSGELANGYVAFCRGGTADKKPLINGSITDTVEYYLTDPANQPYLAACRASGGIYTAIGCVDPTPIGLITGLIRIALGVIGGVALLQLIYVGIQYQLGDEAKIKEARSRLIATITGVAVLVFSILILRIIGVNVLDILPAGSI